MDHFAFMRPMQTGTVSTCHYLPFVPVPRDQQQKMMDLITITHHTWPDGLMSGARVDTTNDMEAVRGIILTPATVIEAIDVVAGNIVDRIVTAGMIWSIVGEALDIELNIPMVV